MTQCSTVMIRDEKDKGKGRVGGSDALSCLERGCEARASRRAGGQRERRRRRLGWEGEGGVAWESEGRERNSIYFEEW